MSDVFSKDKRSEVMKAVKSKNAKTTEFALIRFFKDNHIIGWRRTYPLIGKPDFVFPKRKTVVFVDGCFWHGHNCRNVTPVTHTDFWDKKRAYNKKHDEEVTSILECKGWHVIRVWECELKKKNKSALELKLKCLFD